MNADRSDTFFIREAEAEFFRRKLKIYGYCVFSVLILAVILASLLFMGKYIIAVLYAAAHIAATVFGAKFFIKRERAACDSFEKPLLEMSDEDYEYLLSRSDGFDKMYGSFYMLESYIFVPEMLRLIPYSSITGAKVYLIKSHMVTTGAKVSLSCKNGCGCSIPIKDIALFAEEYKSFEKMLNKKLNKT